LLNPMRSMIHTPVAFEPLPAPLLLKHALVATRQIPQGKLAGGDGALALDVDGIDANQHAVAGRDVQAVT
jgi:hypothetical protein